MAIGSGLGSQFGISAESTYGTYVAPTKFIRARSYNIDRVASRVQGMGISTGQLGPLSSQYVETTVAGTGSVAFDVQNRGLGLMFASLTGTTATPAQAGTWSAYTTTFPIADNYGKFHTIQLGAPYRSGTVLAHSLSGAKCTGAEFSCAVDGLLAASFSFDGKTFSKAQSLATASYTSTDVFRGSQMTLKAGAYSSESAVSGVRSVGMSFSRPMDVSDYTAGSSGAKSEPVMNGLFDITATIEADWLAVATFQDLAHGTTATSLVWQFTGATIASTYVDTFRITLPSVTFEPATQGVDGPGELVNTWNATWRYDGTNLPSIVTVNADSAL